MKRCYPHSDRKNDRYYMNPAFAIRRVAAAAFSKECFVNLRRKLNNSAEARKERGQVTVKEIFLPVWPKFKRAYSHLLTRPGLVDQVEKSLMCGNPDFGYEVYVCPRCGEKKVVPHTCKSRFCTACGKKYRDRISASACAKLIDVPHRQFVFSVPEELRPLFRKDRSRLSLLFKAVEKCFERCLKEKAKGKYAKEGRTPGLILFLHTFGRDRKWHPHLHVLAAERFRRKDGTIGKWSYFSYAWRRKAFMYSLLGRLSKSRKGTEKARFRTLERKVKAKFLQGFYVYGPRMEDGSLYGRRQLTKYVARYASHPAISESRIDSFDRETERVTWHYEPHEDEGKEEWEKQGTRHVTEHAFEFIKRLIVHIPDPGFRQVRYYGFYANKRKAKPARKKRCLDSEITGRKAGTAWRSRLGGTYGFDPLWCHCGMIMEHDRRQSYSPKREDLMYLSHELGFL